MENNYFDIDFNIANTPFGLLFHEVQFSGIFPDSKTFTDCTPKTQIDHIVDSYLKEKALPNFDLKSFVFKNFDLPEIPQTNFKTDKNKSLEQHINSLWPVLTISKKDFQGTYLPLPQPFVVPGGRFQELYYWDSYFTCLGLALSGQKSQIENIAQNFSFLINQYGHVPNGNRSYFLSRSQPPVFALIVNILAEENGDEVLIEYLPALLKEYEFWMKGESELSENIKAKNRIVAIKEEKILSRYWDNLETPRPESYKEDIELAHDLNAEGAKILYRNIRAAAESGWDFSTRWFADGLNMATIQTTDLLPVDLNCLIYFLEKTISSAFLKNGDLKMAKSFEIKYEKRAKLIIEIFWRSDFFYDYNFKTAACSSQETLAACFPLFFKIATLEQAEKVAYKLENDFLKVGGLITTLTHSAQQWDAPNGWAPLQWIAYQGLINYGFDGIAENIKNNWLKKVDHIFKLEGKLTEKYNVENIDDSGAGGEYPNQDGFGWTNGVTMRFLNS